MSPHSTNTEPTVDRRARRLLAPPNLRVFLAGVGVAAMSFGLTTPAHGHGAAPALLSVIASDAQGDPTIVRMSVGLAVRDNAEVWRFACPALWSNEVYTPPVVSAWSDQALVFDRDEGVLLQRDGTALAIEGDTISTDIRSMAALDDTVALYRVKDGAMSIVVFAEDGSMTVTPQAFPLQSITSISGADGQVLAATALNDLDEVQVIYGDTVGFTEPETIETGIDASVAITDLRVAGGRQFVVVRDAVGTAMFELVDPDTPAIEVWSGDVSLHGPIATDDGLVVALDGQLTLLDTLTPLQNDLRITCLQNTPHGPVACAQQQLFRVADDASLSLLLELVDLQPPEWAMSDEGILTCTAQWIDFAFDGGFDSQIDVGVSTDVGADASGDVGPRSPATRGGCATVSSSSSSHGLLVLALVGMFAKRRRQHEATIG